MNQAVLNLCLRCHRRLRTCVCSHLVPFKTDSRFVILMHPKEFKKEKVGTGRFSHLLIENSQILVGINFDEDKRLRSLLEDESYQTFLLYPGSDSISLQSEELRAMSEKKLQFIVIDGTWPCAKKMMSQSSILHKLPRVSFSRPYVSEFAVKHQPTPGCLSTVESLYYLISELKRQELERLGEQHEILMTVFRYTVNQQIELARDPSVQGYRKSVEGYKTERPISKKWSRRKLVFP
jgi:DTW domain-containing protein YfiP